MDIPLDIVTGAVAVATCVLAVFTASLAKATYDAVEQADRHHQDDRRPYLFFDFFEESRDAPFGKLSKPSLARRDAEANGNRLPPPQPIRICGNLSNRGGGLAINVVAYFNFYTSVDYQDGKPVEMQDSALRTTRPKTICGGLGPGEEIDRDVAFDTRDIMGISNNYSEILSYQVETIENNCHEVVFEYEDRFGNIFRTVYQIGFQQNISKAIAAAQGDQSSIDEQITRPDRPGPVFLKGRQSAQSILNPVFVNANSTG
jgi:hypothetical protein